MSGSSWRGMQPERVHDVINRLAQAKQTLATAVTSADTAVNRLKGEWHGGDAQTFFAGWPKVRQDIAASADHVEQLRRVLDHEYQEQRRVSGAGGDSDGDGVPDRRDDDDDGDGTPDGKDDDGDNDGTPDDEDGDDDNDGTPDDQDRDDDNDGTPDDEDEDDDAPVGGSADVPVRDRGGDDDTRDYDDHGDPDGPDGHGGDDSEDHDRSYRNKDGEDWERGRDYQRTWGDEPGDHKAGEHKDESGRPGYEANVNLVEGSYEKTLGPQGTLGDRDGNYIGYDVAKVEADGSAGFTMDGDGVKAGASASAAVMAASVSAQYKNSYGTTATGKAYVGAEANADVGVGLGKNGVEAGAHAEAFAGGKAEANVSQSVGPVDVGVGGEVSYGIGAHADIDAGITKDHVGVSVDVGATLGLGAGVKFDIGFDPPDLPDIDLNPFS